MHTAGVRITHNASSWGNACPKFHVINVIRNSTICPARSVACSPHNAKGQLGRMRLQAKTCIPSRRCPLRSNLSLSAGFPRPPAWRTSPPVMGLVSRIPPFYAAKGIFCERDHPGGRGTKDTVDFTPPTGPGVFRAIRTCIGHCCQRQHHATGTAVAPIPPGNTH